MSNDKWKISSAHLCQLQLTLPSLIFHRFDIQFDGHLVTHDQPARFQGGVPGHTKVSPVDHDRCLNAQMCLSLKITFTVYFERQHYLFGYPVQREDTDGCVRGAALFNPGA